MDWGSDELCHRSAELSGWAEELRGADPADVDDSVPGSVEFAAATGTAGDGSVDDAGSKAPESDSANDAPTRTCGFCRCAVPEVEALDADGHPVGDFEWVGGAGDSETEAYHRECVEAGEGRFLAWTAGGLLADDAE